MASILAASNTGIGGLTQTADSSGDLQLKSSGSAAITLAGANVTISANSSNGEAGQVLTSNGTSAYWGAVNWTYVNSNTTLIAGSYLVDASSQSNINLTLPVNPYTGTIITLQDANNSWGNGLPVVLNNGKTIMGSSSSLTLDTPNIKFTMWYNGSDWRLV